MRNGALFFHIVKIGKLTLFQASLYDISNAIMAKNLKEHYLEEILPEQYHEFLPLCSKVLADRLPPNQHGIKHEVRLNEGETPT